MKNTLINKYLLMTAGILLAAASCTQEEPAGGYGEVSDSAAQLDINIHDGGYMPSGGPETRASENGYTTSFTSGDAAGLYAVGTDGTVLYSNIKVTAAASSGVLSWNLPEGTVIWHESGTRYFMYYPYQEDMTGKTLAAVAAGDTAADFFRALIAGWQPSADQSDYASYTASDLMVAEGTLKAASEDKVIPVDFNMQHCMSLLVLELPGVDYHITSYNSEATACDFTCFVGETAVFPDGTGLWNAEKSIYRYIVRADEECSLSGYYDDCETEIRHDFSVACTADQLKTGQYFTVDIDGGITQETGDYHTLGVVRNGDLLCRSLDAQDWYLIPQEVEAAVPYGQYLDEKDQVIAVVFQTCKKRIGMGEKASLGNKVHGLALSIKRFADSKTGMFTYDGYIPEIGSASTPKQFYEDIEGLQNTKVWFEKNSSPIFFPNLQKFDEVLPRPANTSMWFLPSSGQWWDVAQNLARCEKMATKEAQNDDTTTYGALRKVIYPNSGHPLFLQFLVDAVIEDPSQLFFQHPLEDAVSSTQSYNINKPSTSRQHCNSIYISVNGCSLQTFDSQTTLPLSGSDSRAAIVF